MKMRCSDGLCGGWDCGRCHGENFIEYPCDCCGERFPALAFDDRGLCPDCHDRKEYCEDCGQWFGVDEITNGLCKGCADCKIKGA